MEVADMPKTDQGVNHERYMVIPRTLIFITRGDEILLLKGAQTKRLWANKYNGIGGHIERGEDVLFAARRELEEETGLFSENLHLIGSVMVDASDDVGICLFVFLGDYSGGELRESPEGSLEWIPIKRIGEYPKVEDLKHFLDFIFARNQGSVPFSARSFYDENDQQVIEFT
jgi:8-oxo-dGTP diphosphatase